MPVDDVGKKLMMSLAKLKIEEYNPTIVKLNTETITNDRVLTIPFGALFNEDSYYKWYDQIIKFLNLNGRLICFDYVKYYLSKQRPSIQKMLINYSKNL
jgi:hypothetical protein